MRHLGAMVALLLLALLASAPAQGQTAYPNGAYGQPQNLHAVLSPQDQQDFDKYYAKWVDASRKNDQDDINGNARHMQDIMARYNIPPNVAFDQIASMGGNGAYPQAYPPGAYPANGVQVRLSADDQRDFDKDYSKWMDAQRKNDRDDVAEHARKMQEIMARYNLAPNTPFAAIASNGYAAAQPAYSAPYGYAYGQAPQRLSASDQEKFDKAYHDWAKARRKRDMDDVDKNAKKMQEIMARYNIPANVSFDQVASAGASYH